MGAVMPRYNLENLARHQYRSSVCMGAGGKGEIPLMADDLPEAVQHASVCVGSGGPGGLQLSAILSVGRVGLGSQLSLTLGS